MVCAVWAISLLNGIFGFTKLVINTQIPRPDSEEQPTQCSQKQHGGILGTTTLVREGKKAKKKAKQCNKTANKF